MKTLHYFLIPISIFCLFCSLYLANINDNMRIRLNHQQKVDLPEEYKLITPNDTLKGYYDSIGILHIEFSNHKNK